MNLDLYQNRSLSFEAAPIDQRLTSHLFGLAEEVGELHGIYKRIGRGDVSSDAARDMIEQELGDVLWYLCACATDAGLSMSDVAHLNLCKLSDRQARGVILGSGDNR